MTEIGSALMQITTVLFLLLVAMRGIVRAINLKASWYECFLAVGAITSLIWAVNV
ncbi:MAG: hypothetical protein ACRC30_10925 [Clostridium sp.]